MTRLYTTLIALGLLLANLGCDRPASPSAVAPKVPADLDRSAEVGAAWVREADVVVETIGVPAGFVRIVHPSRYAGTKGVFRLSEIQAALGQDKGSAAVVVIPKILDLNATTNVVTELRRVGFSSVRVVVEVFGRRFPGPEI